MRRHNKFLLIITMLFSCMFLTSCDMTGLVTPTPSNPTRAIASIDVDDSTIPSLATVGSFNITDGDLVVNYTDGITEYIDINYGMITSEDLGKLDTIGVHTITISYNGFTTIYTIELKEHNQENIEDIINKTIATVNLPSSTTSNFILPLTKNGVSITWTSKTSNILINGANAIVTRPAASAADATVVLTASFTYEGITKTKNYSIVVPKLTEQNQNKGNYTGDYYNSISLDLVGTALKTALSNLVQSTHKKYTSYNDCKKYLPNIDEDPNNANNMILFYTGTSIKKSQDLNNDWNREHVWAQSLGWFTTSGAGSDLHHIRPCDVSVNSSRGNKKFGASGKYYTPTDEYKGDVARIIFYLMIAYDEASNYSFTSIAQSKALLLEWNELDPVSELEILRNDKVEAIQGNRNPFIDYPALANSIWG